MKKISIVFYNLLRDTQARHHLRLDTLKELHEDIMDYVTESNDCKRDKYIKNRALRMAADVQDEINRREANEH